MFKKIFSRWKKNRQEKVIKTYRKKYLELEPIPENLLRPTVLANDPMVELNLTIDDSKQLDYVMAILCVCFGFSLSHSDKLIAKAGGKGKITLFVGPEYVVNKIRITLAENGKKNKCALKLSVGKKE